MAGNDRPAGEQPSGASLQVVLGHQPPEERRDVTVLFADLVGSTGLAGRMDPEDLRRLLSAFLTAIAGQIKRFDGTLDKYVGDAVMAVFGAPLSHEDDATRALQAALAIKDAIAQLNGRADIGAARLEVRIGVNSGEVVSGLLGEGVQVAYTVVGEPVNLAQRLQAAARPGEILVAEATHRQVRDFVFDGERQLTVKGRSVPLTVYRLAGRTSLSASADRPAASPLVGRAQELDQLTQAVAAAAAGTGSLIVIVGEPGVGKSRLVAEAREGSPPSTRWLEARAVSIGRTLSYFPFLELIRADAGINDEDDNQAGWAKLERRITALFGEDADDVVPYIASLLALDVPGELGQRLLQLEADAVRRQIFLVSRRYFGALSKERPSVIVFEDLHWFDDSSVELLEHILPLAATLPLVVCVTARPDAVDRIERLRAMGGADANFRIVECALPRLAAEDTAVLVANLLHTDAAPHELRELVVAKTEGNPFFIEELVRSLVELEVIGHDRSSGWTVLRSLAEVDIPDSVQGLIHARIDRLGDDLKRVLRVASVIGRSFYYRVLAAVSQIERDLGPELSALERLEIIMKRAHAPELEYAFRHVLIQESTYESILIRRRRELHLLVAESIESLFAHRVEEFYGFLAYHYARAEDWPKAQEFLFRAADQAGRVAADAEALALYDEAIAAYRRAFGDRWEPLQRGKLESRIGEALFRRGEHGKAAGHLHRALADFGRPFPLTRASVRRGIALELGRQMAHRALPRRLPSPGSARLDALAEEQLRAYEVLGWIHYYLDNEKLLLTSIRLLNESEKRGWALGIVIGSLGMGIVADFIPAFGIAERYHRAGVAQAESLKQPLALGYAYMGLGYHQQRTGDWPAALKHWGHAATQFGSIGELAKWGAATWGTTWLAHRTGDFDRGRRQSEELVRVGQDTADSQLRGWGLYFLGRYLWQSGDTAAGVRSLREAIALFKAIPDLPNLAGASGDLGLCYLREGRWEEAVVVLEQTARLMRDQDVRGFLAHVHSALGEAYLLQAEKTAGAERTRALSRASSAVRSAERRSGVEREGFVGAFRLRGSYEWISGRPDRARRYWHESLRHAENLGARYDLATTHLEIGLRTSESEHLQRAETIFVSLGAQFDVERTKTATPRR